MKKFAIWTIIALSIALFGLLVWYLLIGAKKPKVVIDNAKIQTAQVYGTDQIIFSDDSGSIYRYDLQKEAYTEGFTHETFKEYKSLIASPNSKRAIVKIDSESESPDHTYIINFNNPGFSDPVSNSWSSLAWVGDNQLGYTLLDDSTIGSTSGVYTYDLFTRQSKLLLSLDGSSEDEFSYLGDNLVYVSNSSDNSPAKISIYQPSSESFKVIKEFSFAGLTQFINTGNLSVLVSADKVTVLSTINNNLQQTDLPFSKGYGLFHVDGQNIYKLILEDKVARLELIQFSSGVQVSKSFAVEGYGSIPESYLYSYSISSDSKNITMLTESGVYRYQLK